MSDYKTEQEQFWATEFGNEYSTRNIGADWIASNTAFFSDILKRTHDVQTVIEFGANIGLNLKAIRTLLPEAELSAIEINKSAVQELKLWGEVKNIHEGSILDFESKFQSDFVLIKGVLIHINPNELEAVYEKLYNSSSKYVCIAEYFNPSPVTISYRGHTDRLFKRDFAGEFMDKYPDFELLDYNFVYNRDPNYPQDDITWFLLKKK